MKLTTNDGTTIEGNPEEIMDFYRKLQDKDCDSSHGKNNFPSSRFPCDINPEKFPCDINPEKFPCDINPEKFPCDINPEKFPCDVDQNPEKFPCDIDQDRFSSKYAKSSVKVCRHGHSADFKCEWEKKGYCKRAVLASNPPQYEACEFCAVLPQYRLCSEIDA